MTQIVSSSFEDALLDWSAMLAMFPETKCWLVMLDDWQISLILSLLRYAHWARRWANVEDFDLVDASVSMVERCLMSGCDVSILNDKLDELILAVSELEITSVCTPSVTVTIPQVVNCATQGTGEEAPSGPGEEGEPPPTGWIEPEETAFNRRCRVSNYIYDNIYEFIALLIENKVADLASLGVGLVIGAIIACIVAVLAGPLLVAVAIVGVAASLGYALLAEGIDLDGLLIILSDAAQDIVCALYSAMTAGMARAAVDTVLDNAGANVAQRKLVETCLINDVVNSLFFERDDDYGTRLRIALETYAPSYPCDECETACPLSSIYVYLGTTLSDEIVEGTRTIQIQSVDAGSGWFAVSVYGLGYPGGCCFWLDSVTLDAGTFPSVHFRRLCGGELESVSGQVNFGWTDDECLEMFQFQQQWSGSFTVTVELELCPE